MERKNARVNAATGTPVNCIGKILRGDGDIVVREMGEYPSKTTHRLLLDR